jgi:hypothetical protein
MPFSHEEKCLYGSDALSPELWARTKLCEWFSGKLMQEPYRSALELSELRTAFVSDNAQQAGAIYSGPKSRPVVLVTQGPCTYRDWQKGVNGVLRSGQRIDDLLKIAAGIDDAKPSEDDPKEEARDDALLASFVRDLIQSKGEELEDFGLFNVQIKFDEERQRAASARNPHQITFFLRTLRDWTP